MKARITKLTKNGAKNFFNNGRDFYVVPRYTRALSKGMFIDSKLRSGFDNIEELKEHCRDTFHTYFLDFYMVY